MQNQPKKGQGDRLSLQCALKDSIDVLNQSSHSEKSKASVTGRVAPDVVNVDHAINVGVAQLK